MDYTSVNEFIKLFQKSNETYASLLSEMQRSDFEKDEQLKKNIQDLMSAMFAIEDEVIQFRLKKILKETNPFISSINPEKVLQEKNIPASLFDIFKIFIEQRFELLQTLVNLPREAWKRTGVHADEGHLPFYEFVRRMLEKDSGTITKLTEKIPLN